MPTVLNGLGPSATASSKLFRVSDALLPSMFNRIFLRLRNWWRRRHEAPDGFDEKTQPTVKEDAARIFYHHVFHYMPTHLLSITTDDQEVNRVRFKLVRRDNLRAEEYVPEEVIADRIKLAQFRNVPRQVVIRGLVAERLRYAILSHRWQQAEATFEMVQKAGLDGLGADPPQGYKKLENFCAMAVANGCRLAWADTACIDKRSSAELEQAIRSMFSWYRRSAVCIIYLARSSGIADFKNDPWFTRGWTLQELLAPTHIKFYTKDWTPMRSIDRHPNDKDDDEILRAVFNTTGIKAHDLRHFSPGLLHVREKMVWASKRETMLEEDMAYSLLGIFDVSIPIMYGEGKRAFRRLMEVIIQDCREWQIFAWAGPHSPYAIAFPESPRGYSSEYLGKVDASVLNPERPIHRPWDHGYPFYTTTKRGLKIKVLLVEMLLQIDRQSDPQAGSYYERLVFRPTLENQRYFNDMEAICDPRFLLYSQWAAAIISYQTDGNSEPDAKGKLEGELEANKDYVCFLLGTGIYSAYGNWEKVGTTKVLTIGTKEVVRRELRTVWL